MPFARFTAIPVPLPPRPARPIPVTNDTASVQADGRAPAGGFTDAHEPASASMIGFFAADGTKLVPAASLASGPTVSSGSAPPGAVVPTHALVALVFMPAPGSAAAALPTLVSVPAQASAGLTFEAISDSALLATAESVALLAPVTNHEPIYPATLASTREWPPHPAGAHLDADLEAPRVCDPFAIAGTASLHQPTMPWPTITASTRPQPATARPSTLGDTARATAGEASLAAALDQPTLPWPTLTGPAQTRPRA